MNKETKDEILIRELIDIFEELFDARLAMANSRDVEESVSYSGIKEIIINRLLEKKND